MKERDRPWIMRTYSGHSSAAASNELYRKNLAKGQTGLDALEAHLVAVDQRDTSVQFTGDFRIMGKGLPEGVHERDLLGRPPQAAHQAYEHKKCPHLKNQSTDILCGQVSPSALLRRP